MVNALGAAPSDALRQVVGNWGKGNKTQFWWSYDTIDILVAKVEINFRVQLRANNSID